VTLPEGLVDDPMFFVISRLSDCLCSELAEAKGPGLCYCGLWVGAAAPPLGITADGCETGVAWVRLVGSYPSTVFPQPDDGTLTCATPLAYEVEIGVARPAPRAEGRNLFPDKQAMFEAQRLYASDMRAAKRALLCCLPAAQKAAGEPPLRLALGQYAPMEYGGGKSGGTWQGFIGFA
jgi:hypothetical protein